MITFETERLILRRFSPGDWRDLHEYLSQETVVQYEPYDIYTEEMSREEAVQRAGDEAFWAVCLKDSGKLIGNVYFKQRKPHELRTWEIGYVFNPHYYRKGYATESCREILRFGFEMQKAHRIVAMCNPENTASWKLLERLQMRREGHLRRNIFFKHDNEGNPIWTDTYEYAILAEEWIKAGEY